MKIREVTKYSGSILDGLNKLIPQLTGSKKEVPEKLFRMIIEDEDVHLYIAEENGTIIGALTLVIYPIPSELRVIIEDVVVDGMSRGKGIGQKLIMVAIEKAKERGATFVNLTSNPNRVPANALYQKMGFSQRETNVYRYDI